VAVAKTLKRRRVLETLGAGEREIQTLLARNRPLSKARCPAEALPPEPQTEDWRQLQAFGAGSAAWSTVLACYPQLHFLPQEGLSRTPAWRAAVLGGAVPPEPSPLADPEGVALERVETPGGELPALVFANREDFARCWRLLAWRGEPVELPDSMGAALVRGVINWERFRRHLAQWCLQNPAGTPEQAFAAVQGQGELYRDRLILATRGSYSDIPTPAGFTPEAWRTHSLAIRLAHEGVHDFTSRVFGQLGHTVQEELVADWWGLVKTFGHYEPQLAQQFLGVEDPGRFRPGGRLATYQGEPPLSSEAFAVLCRLVRLAVETLAAVPVPTPAQAPKALVGLLSRSLEELAASSLEGGPV